MVKKLFDWWATNFFLDPISGLTALTGLLIFNVRRDKKNTVYIFSYYFLGYVVLKLFIWLNDIRFFALTQQQRLTSTRAADYLFTLFEFVIFVSFFKKTIFFKIHQRILVILFYLFLIVGGSLFLYDFAILGYMPESSLSLLFNIQAFSLLIPSGFYYSEVFQSKPTADLLQTPSFWVVTGLTFSLVSTLPFSILLNSLWKNRHMVYYYVFDLFYVFYIILFLMIIRAYLCKQATVK